MTKRIVHLRVYKGKDLNYDVNGKVKNENQLVKLTHGSNEWRNFLRHLIANGYCSVDVEKVFNGKNNEIKSFADITAEVKEASKVDVKDRPKSDAEIENEKLKSQIEKLKENNTNDMASTPEPIDYDDYTLAGLEKKYPEVAKKGFTSREDFIKELTK